MTEINITTEEAAQCLRVLQAAKGPMVAAGLARRLRLHGVRETQRRHIRAIIEHLRKNGSWIVGLNPEGYFLTKDRQIWRDYNEGRGITAKRIFAEVHKRKRMIQDGTGQGFLFGQRVTVGLG
jgi:hypothetical protein